MLPYLQHLSLYLQFVEKKAFNDIFIIGMSAQTKL